MAGAVPVAMDGNGWQWMAMVLCCEAPPEVAFIHWRFPDAKIDRKVEALQRLAS